jgi:hypothetical protein
LSVDRSGVGVVAGAAESRLLLDGRCPLELEASRASMVPLLTTRNVKVSTPFSGTFLGEMVVPRSG